jgi:hypothetical protein
MRRHPLSTWLSTLVLLCGLAQARDLFVDQHHPLACDTNAGMESAPFTTIQPAVNAAKPGDTIWVKAGVYQEAIEIKSSGTLNAPITLSAWSNDHVRLGSVLQPLPPAAQWKPLSNSRSWAVQLPAEPPPDLVVILDDKPIVTQYTNTLPAESNINWATYRAADRTLMVNAGSNNPAAEHTLQSARNYIAVTAREQTAFWRFQKLEFAWVNGALGLIGTGYQVEHCYFHDTYREGIFLHSRLTTVRCCNFHQCGYGISASGSGPGNIIEDCLFVESGQDWEQDIRARELNYQEGGGPFGIKGDAYGQLFRYNVVADNKGGLWYDGGETGCRVIGNAFWDNRYGNGIYNEYAADDTTVIGNYFLHATLTSSWCTRLNIYDNFFEGYGVVWCNRDRWPLRNSFMTLRGNAFIDVPGGYLQHFGAGWGASMYEEGFRNCLVDFNHVRVRPGTELINDCGRRSRTMAEIRTNYGWEAHGDIGEYHKETNDLTPETMGATVVTLRVPWGPKSHLSRPMLADGHINGKWPAAAEVKSTCAAPSFFWRVADGQYNDATLRPYEPWFTHEFKWQPGSTAGYGLGENNGCRWYVDAEPITPTNAKIEGWPNVPELSSGNHWLVMAGITPEKIPPQGVGYWSPWLSTAPGAKIKVTLRIRGRDVGVTEKGTPAVWLQFINETGQNPQRAWLVGRDAQGQAHHPELLKGSFDWTSVAEPITAPQGAIRMALFFGLTPCKGELNFDDITLATEPESAPPVAQQEILGPRLPLERIKESFFVDFTGVVNRGLADQTDNDGVGGWTDQGADCDMRALKTGERKFGGVPFRILPAPRSVVVLHSGNRTPGTLPDRVTIPVGRKLDTLFFLHASAWTPDDGREIFRYVLHYKDGQNVTLIVDSRCLSDWARKPVSRFPYEEGTFSTVAETVPVERFGQGSIYRMEWSAPTERRSVEIESLEFANTRQIAVPVLLGITGVTEW